MPEAPTSEDIQDLRGAIESLRDHVQIVWQAIDEVREVIDRALGPDSPDIWTVEPSQGFGLGRYRPFAGYNPFDEWQAENDEAPVEPPPVPLTSDSEVEAARVADMSESQLEEAAETLADTHRHNGRNTVVYPPPAVSSKQRSLFEAAQRSMSSEITAAEVPATAEFPLEGAEPARQAEVNTTEAQVRAAASSTDAGGRHCDSHRVQEWAAGAEPQYFAPLSGTVLVSLMQRHRVTIGELASRTGITQKRIREAREQGLHDRNAVRDWLQAILGRDPGPIGERPAEAPYTLDDWIEFRHRFSDGEVDAAGILEEYRRMKAGKAHFIDQLVQSKTADELRLMAMQAGCFDASRNTKQRNAEALYRTHLSAFALGESVRYSPMQETFEEALEKMVLALTDEKITAQREKNRREREAREKALTNPETYEELSQFVARKGTGALSDEQLATWDRMQADISRAGRKAKQKDTVEQFQASELADIELSIIDGHHTRDNVPLWIVQLSNRVERSAFKELLVKARSLGGNWSSFHKHQAGFQFRSKESAEKFTGLNQSDADRSEELLARKLRKMDSASERLTAVAVSLETKAAEVLAADSDKLKNTARRADMAASMRADAYRDQADAKTLHSIAGALAEGNAQYLDGIWNAAQVRTLGSILRQAKRERIEQRLKEAGIERARHRWSLRYEELEAEPLCVADARLAKFPKPHLYRQHLVQALAKLATTPGAKQVTAKMRKLVDSRPKDEEFIEFINDYQVELLEDFISRAKAAGYSIWWFDHCLDDYKRLKAANIHDNHELRCALRELVPHLSTVAGDDPVMKAEDELRKKAMQLPDFFPTPRPIIEQMLDAAEIEPMDRVLEPSAGKGDILTAIRQRHPEADLRAIEQNLALQGILTAKGFSDIVTYGDFLEHSGEYTRIVMNPPFSGGQDMAHIRHAYELLATGGRLVAIASEHGFFASDAKSVAFREWLCSLDDAHDEELPDDAFKGVDAYRQTGVKTRLLVINKS
jgi:hypothetical protein